MTSYRKNACAKLVEGSIIVGLFAIFVHLTTSKSLSYGTLIVSASMVLIAVGLCSKRVKWSHDSAPPMWVILTALASGFWFFSLFRFMGLVVWPLSRSADLIGFTRLLYFHVVLSVSVLTPLFITRHIVGPIHMLSWGNWKDHFFSIPARAALWISLLGIWVWALNEVLSREPKASGPVTAFVVISILKAILTGVTEEVCYRGIIQPAAIERFGLLMGISLQSCLYTVFHMHLGAAFFSHTAFLTGVMALGLTFGAITHLTGGIGWAFSVHTAINLVIEWHNLS